MFPSRLQTSVSLFLLAALLLGNVVPPSYGHSHAGGDVPHVHGNHAQVNGCQGHDHGHDGHRHPQQQTAELSPKPVAHLHLVGFFFEVTLPLGDPTESEPTDLDDASILLLRWVGDFVTATHEGLWIQPDRSLPTAVSSSTPALAGTASSQFVLPVAVLLCDSARHERSGVQLF